MPSRANADFPSFWEGLSLRQAAACGQDLGRPGFPFLFGRAFIEARKPAGSQLSGQFPFLLGRAFIEARRSAIISLSATANFPFFLEGLSLRLDRVAVIVRQRRDFPSFFGRGFIEAPTAPALFLLTRSFSLPFRKGFHRGDGYVANNGYVWFIFLPIRRGFL